jgi:hypothetical protein
LNQARAFKALKICKVIVFVTAGECDHHLFGCNASLNPAKRQLQQRVIVKERAKLFWAIIPA